MRLLVFRYHCGACGKWFNAPDVSELAYGEFLLRSDYGELRYLNAIDDPAFAEADHFMKNDSRAATLDSHKCADLLHDIFRVTCDPDQQGSEFRIGRKARCLHCHERNVINWESVEPPKYIELEVLPVTHEAWSKWRDDQKQAAISAAIDASGII